MPNNLNGIQKAISEIMPSECGLAKVELEGPDIAVYMKNIRAFYEDNMLIRKLAAALRKRVLIRSDQSSLLPPDAACARIKAIIPQEAGVTDIKFMPEFSEVMIDSMKPGLVIGKGGLTLKEIILQTGWAPRIVRTPTMPSETIKGMRSAFVKESANRKKFLLSLGKRICSQVAPSDWVKVSAIGGFKEVGRTCILIQTPNMKTLIDCGVNPETTEAQKAYPYLNALNIELSELDAVIVTHAHLDHCGFVPYLFAYGYDGPVYCTPPTKDLMALLQFDYLEVLAKSHGATPPYAEKDVRKMLSKCVAREYEEVTDITPETKLTLHNAGHILGSSMVHLHIGEGLHNFVYTGDLKYGFTRLFEPANTAFPRVESLFIESTYGGREDAMPQRGEAEARLAQLIGETLQKRGKVLVPVFSVGRSQEIMLVLEQLSQSGEAGVPPFSGQVYIDGMIREASAIHTAYPEYLRQSVQRRILSNKSPFESEIFEPVKGNMRKDIVEGDPCVILAPSGMLSGGPSVEYLKLLAEDEKNLLLFVGYQTALSLGRKIQRGTKEIPIADEEGRLEKMEMKMRVETVEGFSGHCDRGQLLSFVKNIRPQPEKVFTLHGDENKCEDLARSISKLVRGEVRAPMNLDAIRLK